mgnify:CR=1 FL=1
MTNLIIQIDLLQYERFNNILFNFTNANEIMNIVKKLASGEIRINNICVNENAINNHN